MSETPDELSALIRERAALLHRLVELDSEIATKQRENITATVGGMLAGPYASLSERITRLAEGGIDGDEGLYALYQALTERVNALAEDVQALRAERERRP